VPFLRLEPLAHDLARCYAGKRDRKQVLSHLDAARSLGRKGGTDPLEPEFAWLRGDPELERLVSAPGD